MNENQIFPLFVGYSHMDTDQLHMKANSSVTLIRGEHNIVLVGGIYF